MGVGKASSTTLKLDVLGDAGISGTATVGTLSATTANITDLNATRINGSTQILIQNNGKSIIKIP
jgi:hypothetical protein